MITETMMIELTGEPNSDVVVKIGHGNVLVSYDRKGCLRLIREVKTGQKADVKPKNGVTVFRVIDFHEGKASFKSSAGHCGFLSVNGFVYWGTIWDDNEEGIIKTCSFQNWVNECAEVLAGEKESISST